MDGTLFEEWLRELDRKFEMQGRKFVMIVDNCHAHSEVLGLKAIKLQFSRQILRLVHNQWTRVLSGMLLSHFIVPE